MFERIGSAVGRNMDTFGRNAVQGVQTAGTAVIKSAQPVINVAQTTGATIVNTTQAVADTAASAAVTAGNAIVDGAVFKVETAVAGVQAVGSGVANMGSAVGEVVTAGIDTVGGGLANAWNTGSFAGAAAGVGMGAGSVSLDELTANSNRLDQNTLTLAKTFQSVQGTLIQMSSIIGGATTLGRGMNHLAETSRELSRKANDDLVIMRQFMSSRIEEARTGSAISSGELDALGADLMNINF